MTVSHAIEHGEGPVVAPVGQPAAAGPGYEAPHPGYPAAQSGYAAYPGPHVRYVVAEPNRFTRFLLRLHDRSPRWAAPAAIAACFAGTASYVWVLDPTVSGADYVSTCVVKLTTGLDCPGCGGTRAFYYLMQGNVPEAVRHHAMAVFAAPFLVWLYLAWSVKQVFGRQIPVPQIGAKTISWFLGGWLVFMVVRNLPFVPFTFLYV